MHREEKSRNERGVGGEANTAQLRLKIKTRVGWLRNKTQCFQAFLG